VEADDLDSAMADYTTLLIRPDLSLLEIQLANFNLGVLHHRKGDIEKCLSHWEQVASAAVPGSDVLVDIEGIELAAAANMNLGAHYVLNKQMEKGLVYLTNAAQLDPDDGEIRYNIGATLASLGQYEEAISQFEAAEEKGVEAARDVINKIKQGLDDKKQQHKEGEGSKQPSEKDPEK